jgi:hypothetical protein
MLIDEVLSFSRDYINNRIYRTAERKAKIKEVLIQLTGEKINFGCSTCYIEALFKILNLTKMATPKGYELKQGVLLEAFGDASKTCTNLTLTDELAEWYLKNQPEKAIYFSKIPAQPAYIPPVQDIVLPEEVIEKEVVIPEVEEVAEALIEMVTEPKKKGGRPKTKK